ncbi:MAG TPA: MBL fold metallo-hydrolase [Bryobacteraceae bacterium]|nr:MBL fold metallo-hydrolase [Bryobacteraceae bacterium]
MKPRCRFWCAFFLFAVVAAGAKPLRVYFVDVEGGQATLVAAPSGDVLLIDTGWNDERDARRIEETAHAAGITAIDALLITHFHRDHAGGVAGLAALLPIRTVFDHGEDTENYKGSPEIMSAYRKAIPEARRKVVHPGDKIPIRGLDISVITSGGQRITSPLPGAGARNPVCGTESRKPDEHTENAQSVGVLIEFGKFRMLDLGDLLWNQELDLMCPLNPIGQADLLVVSHHGKDTSNSATLIHAVHPRAALMDNSETKGGSPAVFDILRSSPGFQDLWQLHYSIAAGARNAGEKFIANPHGTCHGSAIEVTAERDGSFRVTNEGNHFQKTYGPTD